MAPNGPEHFAGMVEYMDELVGRIADHVENLGLSEHTLLLFTSDNGTHRRITSRIGDREIRGGKNTTTSAGTHVPLVAHWPGTIRPGTVCDDLIDFSDFYATLAELTATELDPDRPMDGVSFAPQLRGELR